MTSPSRLRVGFLVVLFFVVTSAILSSYTQFGTLVLSIFSHVQFEIFPVFTRPSTTIKTSTNAPWTNRKPPQSPPSFTATPASLVEDAKTICNHTKELLDRIAEEITLETATFENVVFPIGKNEDFSNLQRRIITFYQIVSPDPDLREASSKAEELLDEFKIESSMREDIFKLVDAVHKKGEKLDPESQRLLEKERKSYITNGLGIPAGPQRDEFKRIKMRLSQIQIEFHKNLNEENGGVWLTKEELDGLPKSIFEGLERGTGDNEGKFRLTFKYPDLFPALEFVLDSDVRQRMFIENENRCNSNIPLFKEAIVLRDQAARLLGYPDHATFRIEEKMAKTPEMVNHFLDDLRVQLAIGGAKEIAHLLDIKQEDLTSRGLEVDGNFYLWDTRFYNRIMIEKEFSLYKQEFANYFPLESTIEGMLNIFEALLGLVFIELVSEERINLSATGREDDLSWHEDVKIFSVWDSETEGSSFVGYLYLDLHPRPGKYGHAANFSLRPGFIFVNGSRNYPTTALVCNFSKPTPTTPSLLKHEEVVYLFHELGHAIHDLTSRTQFSRFHGTSVVQDFIEAPSQMLENWCWNSNQLKRLSKHYLTGHPIPDDLVEKQISTKHVNDALLNLRQLHFSIFDMTIHTPKSHVEVENLEVSELYNELWEQISGLKGPEALGLGIKSNWGNGQATFGHVMSDYDAGYYGYLFSQVYSTDMFYSTFKKDPMDPNEGRRYRHMVLEKGGGQEEMQTLTDFLGRPPSTEPFYRELGLKAE